MSERGGINNLATDLHHLNEVVAHVAHHEPAEQLPARHVGEVCVQVVDHLVSSRPREILLHLERIRALFGGFRRLLILFVSNVTFLLRGR